jgi:hypothetical protein
MTDRDATEAVKWIATEIARLRSLTYQDLVQAEGRSEHRRKVTAGGRPLVLERQVFWDDEKKRTLRVIVDVWDPAKRVSRSIATDDFIRAPDGSFVDE